MGYQWEGRDEAEADATPEQVWEAITTGPGVDSWYMGRTEIEPGLGGAVRTDFAGMLFESTVVGWEPGRRFAYRGDEGEDGRFIAFEFLIEGREKGSAVLRLVANGFLPGDDWEAEFDAMTKGGQMYLRTLVAYLTHFAGRTATPVTAFGPIVPDWDRAWPVLHEAIGLTGAPNLADPVRFAPEGLPPVEGVVDFVNPHALGLRTEDALYRFVRGFFGPMVIGHHLFSRVDPEQAARAWQEWLNRLFG